VEANGGDPAAIAGSLVAVGVEVEPLWREDAERAASLWASAPELSLADRCCLALAQRLDVAAATADRTWVDRVPGVDVVVIR
jgi:ribonuclease VapC